MSYYMEIAHHYYEPDDPEPWTKRFHCSKCGAFISSTPVVVENKVPKDWEYVDNPDDWENPTVIVTAWEDDYYPTWTCRKCGSVHDDPEELIAA